MIFIKFKRLLKENSGNLLILLGILIIGISFYTGFKWRYTQAEFLDESQVLEEDNPKIEDDEGHQYLEKEAQILRDELLQIKAIKRENKELFKRVDYKRGMMIIEIPKIEVRAAVIEGTTKELLKKGPGLYEISPLPDDREGNVCIAGHRTTYGAWFRHVDQLESGDMVVLSFKGKKYTYQVKKVFIIAKNDWSVTESVGYPSITLTACHPLRSSRQRIVVRGRLTSTEGNS